MVSQEYPTEGHGKISAQEPINLEFEGSTNSFVLPQETKAKIAIKKIFPFLIICRIQNEHGLYLLYTRHISYPHHFIKRHQ